MGYQVTHKRIKPKYRPTPNAAEARYEAMMREQPCYGCGGQATELHHTLLKFPEKGPRRDHRFQLPLCGICHRGRWGIHGIGREELWLEYVGRSTDEAIAYMLGKWAESENV